VGDETPGVVVVLVVDDGGGVGAVVVTDGTVAGACTGDLGRVALEGVGGAREDSDAARS